MSNPYPYPVGTWNEGPPDRPITVSSFRLWCTTADGKTYRRYVDVLWKNDFGATQPPEGGWPPDVVDTLYRAQLQFERSPDTYGPPVTSSDGLDQLKQDSTDPSPTIAKGFREREN